MSEQLSQTYLIATLFVVLLWCAFALNWFLKSTRTPPAPRPPSGRYTEVLPQGKCYILRDIYGHQAGWIGPSEGNCVWN